MTVKLHDLLNPKPVETRSADEIIDGIRNKIENMK